MSTTWVGVRAMAAHEFKLRLRAGRWKWLLGAWFVVLLAFTALEWAAIGATVDGDRGTTMFGGLMLAVLALGLLVVPALTAQSVNGDRERGVLATLQVTLLTPWEITLGKLAAAWGVALVFLATTLPLVAWCIAARWRERRSRGRDLAGRRAVARRPGRRRAVPVVVARAEHDVGRPLLPRGLRDDGGDVDCLRARARGHVDDGDGAGSTAGHLPERRDRRGRVRGVHVRDHGHAPRAVLVDHRAESVRRARGRRPATVVPEDQFGGSVDPLEGISNAVRATRDSQSFNGIGSEEEPNAPVWPYGLGINLLIGAGALALTARRLRTPYRELPKAVRVA